MFFWLRADYPINESEVGSAEVTAFKYTLMNYSKAAAYNERRTTFSLGSSKASSTGVLYITGRLEI